MLIDHLLRPTLPVILILFGISTVLLFHAALGQLENSTVQQLRQNGVIMQFSYSPSNPVINNYTNLMFNVINLTTNQPVQKYIGKISIGSVVGFTGGSGYYTFDNITVTNGSFSVKYAFPNDGLFPVYFNVEYPTSNYGPESPIAIGEFKVIVPAPQVIPSNDNTMIYVGIGIAAAVGGAAVIMIKRKHNIS